MSKNVNIQYLGETFTLPANAVQSDNKGITNYIYMGAKNTASIIKQYVKKKYGNRITVWSNSEVYSGGSSVRVNVWSKNGSQVPYEIYEDIKSFSNSLKGGSFDGMYDIYNCREDNVETTNGTPMKYFPSYIFVSNDPKWDSVEYWLSNWKKFDPSNYDRKMVGNTLWEQFVNFNSSFWKKGTIEKLQKHMNELETELKKLGYTEEELAA